MYRSFFHYFLNFIFKAKSRQSLLLLSSFGLFLSSFSLLVLNSTMGGLQNGLIQRSKNVFGAGIIKSHKNVSTKELRDFLSEEKIEYAIEFQSEILVQNPPYTAPAIIHGLDPRFALPKFLEAQDLKKGLVVGYDFARKLKVFEDDGLNLFAPGHVNELLGDTPRFTRESVYQVVTTDLPEVDAFHIWTDKVVLQNLLLKKDPDLFRVYSKVPIEEFQMKLNARFNNRLSFTSWEEMNSTLLQAFRLETTVMMALFLGMSFLVGIAISTGFLVFFDKIKLDMTSFWILGLGEKRLEKGIKLLVVVISFLACFGGLLISFILLWLYQKYGFEIMPDIFVDRKIPIKFSWVGIMTSFGVPFILSLTLGLYTLRSFKKSRSEFIGLIRNSY